MVTSDSNKDMIITCIQAESFRLLKMDSKRISETIDQVNNRMEEMSVIFK